MIPLISYYILRKIANVVFFKSASKCVKDNFLYTCIPLVNVHVPAIRNVPKKEPDSILSRNIACILELV